MMVDFVREEVRSVLRLASPPPAEVGFFDLGMDSLMAVELRNRVNRALSGEYTAPNTLVFDYPNAGKLGRHLLAQLGELAAPVRVGGPRPAVLGERSGSRWWGWRADSPEEGTLGDSGRSWPRAGTRCAGVVRTN